jgi:penicillin-insensitive murein endopeptidase
MAEVLPQDTRAFFMLPQAPEGAGYYVYGTPDKGQAQYTHPGMMTLLLAVERQWSLIDRRKFGIGNISVSGGFYFGHKSHRKGLEVDLRPLRKDGKRHPVTYFSPEYDREGTALLIGLFHTCAPGLLVIFFNDTRIPGTRPLVKHDDHFHVQF